MKKLKLLILVPVVLSGCSIRITKSAQELVNTNDAYAVSLKASHISLINEYFQCKEDQIRGLVFKRWTLNYLNEYTNDANVIAICDSLTSGDNFLALELYLKNKYNDVLDSLSEKSKGFIDPLRKLRDRTLYQTTLYYDEIRLSNARLMVLISRKKDLNEILLPDYEIGNVDSIVPNIEVDKAVNDFKRTGNEKAFFESIDRADRALNDNKTK